MSNYTGKHILLDCYGCKTEHIQSKESLLSIITAISKTIKIELIKTEESLTEEEVILAGFGLRSQVCIHAYPQLNYVAADIYTFEVGFNPTLDIQIMRKTLAAEKIRATSIRRGNIDAHPDMKPTTKSKTTTLRKVKNVGRQINQARKKFVSTIRKKTI